MKNYTASGFPISGARACVLSYLLLPGVAVLCLLTGCVSKEKIPFSDEAEMAREQATVVAGDEPAVQKLSAADESQVETAVYASLLARDLYSTNQFTAVFLQGSDEEVARVQSQFPGHIPPIKASNHASLTLHQPPVDKDTGRPAIILSVETGTPTGDTLVAVGRWYAGDNMSGSSDLIFKKTGDNWEVQSVK